MHEQSTFDLERGEQLKEAGIKQAVEFTDPEILSEARDLATRWAKTYGHVTIDDIYMALDTLRWDVRLLGPCAGSIFKGKQWEFTGEWRKSTRASNHARYIRVWRLKS